MSAAQSKAPAILRRKLRTPEGNAFEIEAKSEEVLDDIEKKLRRYDGTIWSLNKAIDELKYVADSSSPTIESWPLPTRELRSALHTAFVHVRDVLKGNVDVIPRGQAKK